MTHATMYKINTIYIEAKQRVFTTKNKLLFNNVSMNAIINSN